MFFAGIRAERMDTGTFAIVVTGPNAVTAVLHERMPVLIRPEDASRWLNPFARNVASLRQLLVPYAAEERVFRDVNRPGNEGPGLIGPI